MSKVFILTTMLVLVSLVACNTVENIVEEESEKKTNNDSIHRNEIKKNPEFDIRDSLYYKVKESRSLRRKNFPKMFKAREVDWKKYEIKLDVFVKDSLLKLISGNKFFNKPYIIYREEYHFVDFNKDGKTDIIYTGRKPSGSESDNFAFFENQGDSIRLLLKSMGTIVEYRDSTFKSWNWPCCAGQSHFVRYFTFYNNNDTKYNENNDLGRYSETYGTYSKNYYPNYRKVESFHFIKSTFLPTVENIEDTSKKIAVKVKIGELETNPSQLKENRRLNEFIREEYDSNIVICELLKGTKGFVLKQESFRNNEYVFVKMDISKTESDLNINDTEVKNLLGWIRKSSIEPIDQ